MRVAFPLSILTLGWWDNFITTKIAAAMPAIAKMTPEMLVGRSSNAGLIEGGWFPEPTPVTSHKYVAHAVRQIHMERI